MAILEKKPENLDKGARYVDKLFSMQGPQIKEIVKEQDPDIDEYGLKVNRQFILATTIAGAFTSDIDIEREKIMPKFGKMAQLLEHMKRMVDDIKKSGAPGFQDPSPDITYDMIHNQKVSEGLPETLKDKHERFEKPFLKRRPEAKEISFLFTIGPVLFEIMGIGDPTGEETAKVMPTELLEELVFKLDNQLKGMLETESEKQHGNK